ncbi:MULTISPECIES: inositol monophosphatase family protein [unclassified Streptococcus]|uniref:inositol monophosphatase family protein n=1 Tax=unclassified Streptococcus TaxID=2608887 RepID=UPI00066FCA21|nr:MULTISPECIES: inositol monophosphatase family protein [unclassified Streptococcus]
MATLETKYQFAQDLVKEAGAFLRQHLHDDLKVEIKSHFTDLVTHLDKDVQDNMSQAIVKAFPNDHIYGEENENRHPIDQGNVWVIDPIDGTSNFIVQRSDFAVLLAYFEDGQGKFGLIYDVMSDTLYHGGGAFPVYEDDQLLSKFTDKPFSEGMIGLNAGLYAQNFADFADQFVGIRSLGSAGLSFSRVLNQRLMAHVSYVYPWDYAAASILGEALGYILVNEKGEKPSFNGREHVILIAKEKLEELKGFLK